MNNFDYSSFENFAYLFLKEFANSVIYHVNYLVSFGCNLLMKIDPYILITNQMIQNLNFRKNIITALNSLF